MQRKLVCLLAAALAALAILAHLPALTDNFIWDDDDHLTQNPYVASPTGWREIWSSLAAARYYPLTLTSFWAGRQLFGLNPLPYHLLNVLLHSANAVLAWLVLRRLHVRGAWIAAALWAVHPVIHETVAWITELKNIQSTFFLLLALWYWLKHDQSQRRADYALALVTFAAALLSKPATVTLPALLLLCLWWRHSRWFAPAVLRTIPFFAFSAGMSVVTILEQRRQVLGAAAGEWHLGLGQRLLISAQAVWFYAGKLFWPRHLSFIYPRWASPVDLWTGGAAALALATLAVLLLLLQRRHPWARAALFSGGCFLVALAPVLAFFNIYYFRFSFVSDHFNYLPSLALLALAPAAVTGLVADRRAQATLAAVAILLLGLRTWQRAPSFRTEEQLWQDTLHENPAAAIAHNNLGSIYRQRGDFARATNHFETARQLDPQLWEPAINLGKVQLDQHRYTLAVTTFHAALDRRPNLLEARYGLGMAYTQLGRFDEARTEFTTSLAQRPDQATVYFWLGLIDERAGRPGTAIEKYQRAIQLDPQLLDAFLHLGQLRLQQREWQRAQNCFQTALKLDPDNASARQGLAQAQRPPAP